MLMQFLSAQPRASVHMLHNHNTMPPADLHKTIHFTLPQTKSINSCGLDSTTQPAPTMQEHSHTCAITLEPSQWKQNCWIQCRKSLEYTHTEWNARSLVIMFNLRQFLGHQISNPAERFLKTCTPPWQTSKTIPCSFHHTMSIIYKSHTSSKQKLCKFNSIFPACHSCWPRMVRHQIHQTDPAKTSMVPR